MSSIRRTLARGTIAVVLVATFGPLAAAQAQGSTAVVTGFLESSSAVAGGPGSVAVIVLVDQSNGAGAGSIVGLQRIDAPGGVPIPFEVPYETSAIRPTGSYAIFASVQSGSSAWQNLVGVPVITGGPSDGVSVALTPVPTAGATVSGQLVMASRSPLSSSAVGIAALIKTDTGTIVGSQVLTNPSSSLSFALGYDPGTIDPGATYVVRGGVFDPPRAWTAPSPVTVINDGAPTSGVDVPVAPSSTTIPTPPPAPTTGPTTAPTTAPTTGPTTAPKIGRASCRERV